MKKTFFKLFMLTNLVFILTMNRLTNFNNKLKQSAFIFNTEKRYISKITSNFRAIEHGIENTDTYRIFFENIKNNKLISPFHDIPLYHDKKKLLFNMVVEIPRWTNAKMEISKQETLNPIRQDFKNNKLRFVHNIFPYYGYIWNYGCLPQTWEDPNHVDESTKKKGDNDPLDVCEIGSIKQERGDVIVVKVLGSLGLIDEDEADWKLIVIDVNDPLAKVLNDISDVKKNIPGLLDATRDWFKIYKVPAGKPVNKFALNGEFMDRNFTIDLIEKAHTAWNKLIHSYHVGRDISILNTTLNNSHTINDEKANSVLIEQTTRTTPEKSKIDLVEVEQTHYIDRSKV